MLSIVKYQSSERQGKGLRLPTCKKKARKLRVRNVVPIETGRFRPGALLLLGLLAALAVIVAGCGTDPETPIHRTGPIWTPAGSPAVAPPEDGAWPGFDFDAARSGFNPNEKTITSSTVGGLHRLWNVLLPAVADSTPILVPRLSFPDGSRRDVLYLTTKPGSLVALDAATGGILWVAKTSGPRYTTSSPVADLAHGVIYSYGLDGKLHQYRAATGQEVMGGGWPVLITTMPASEKGSSALNLGNGYVYVTTGGYPGDAPPYQGHVVAIDTTDGTSHVFNSLCSDRTHVLAHNECSQNTSGIWSRAGVTIDPITGNIFMATGNGDFDANKGGHDWGDTVLELNADATRLIDSYTPPNFQELQAGDTDLGSASPALLPTVLNSHTPYLAVQVGKDGQLRLLDRQNLSGQGGPGHLGGALQTINAPGGCDTLSQPAVWTDPANGKIWLFVTNSCGTGGYQAVTAGDGTTTLRQVWEVKRGATSPVVAGGVLFAATGGNLFALDPHTGHQLWSSTERSAGGSIGGIHWESPIVVGGRLYCTDENGRLAAYGL